MKQEFKFRKNTATLIFLTGYTLYVLIKLILQDFKDLPLVVAFGVLLFIIFIGCRPNAYEIENRRMTIKYPLWKNKEVDLMRCDTICDPVSRMADLVTRPHAIEIYTENNKRYCCFPKDRQGFVGAVVNANKRINCQVHEYNETHRKFEKKRRRENKREKAQLEEGTH